MWKVDSFVIDCECISLSYSMLLLIYFHFLFWNFGQEKVWCMQCFLIRNWFWCGEEQSIGWGPLVVVTSSNLTGWHLWISLTNQDHGGGGGSGSWASWLLICGSAGLSLIPAGMPQLGEGFEPTAIQYMLDVFNSIKGLQKMLRETIDTFTT